MLEVRSEQSPRSHYEDEDHQAEPHDLTRPRRDVAGGEGLHQSIAQSGHDDAGRRGEAADDGDGESLEPDDGAHLGRHVQERGEEHPRHAGEKGGQGVGRHDGARDVDAHEARRLWIPRHRLELLAIGGPMIEELDETHQAEPHHRYQKLLRIEAGRAQDDRLPHER